MFSYILKLFKILISIRKIGKFKPLEKITEKCEVQEIYLEDKKYKHLTPFHKTIRFTRDDYDEFFEIDESFFLYSIFDIQSKIEKIEFRNCKFEKCIFSNVQIKNCEFHNCYFIDCRFHRVNFTNVYLDPDSFIFNHNWAIHWSNINLKLFQELYRNSKELHQNEFAMSADIKFNKYKIFWNFNGPGKNRLTSIRLIIYYILFNFGYGFWNSFISALLLIYLYSTIITNYLSNEFSTKGLLSSIYFSIITFTSIGYGDIHSNGETISLWASIVFALLSFFWCGITTAILIKRVVK